MFMLVDVPLPVWKTSTGNWSAHRPPITWSAAATMASAAPASTCPLRPFTTAAARLMAANADSRPGSTVMPDTGKFSTARWVWAFHLARIGTSMSPNESCSVRDPSGPTSLLTCQLLTVARPRAVGDRSLAPGSAGFACGGDSVITFLPRENP